jgi:hypothetical protein
MITSSSDRTGVRFVAPEHGAAAARIGARVLALRTERGFSPQEFAALAAISTADLAAVEAGDARTSIAALLSVAEALDLDLAALTSLDHTVATPVAALVAAPAHVTPVHVAPAPVAPAPAPPVRQYVTSVAPVSRPVREPGPRPVRTGTPRTFADLRQGVLAGRTFPTLPHFAVAAVVEAGHAVSVVARIFRVPAWKLDGWVRDGVADPPAVRTRQWS